MRSLTEAVERAIDACIEEEILADFLRENRLALLLQKLMAAGRNEDINRAISDSTYREQLYRESGIDVSI